MAEDYSYATGGSSGGGGGNDHTSTTSFYLPKELKLKGEENFAIWKPMVMHIARANGLDCYITKQYVEALKPPPVDWTAKDAADMWKKDQVWRRGDARMRMCITLNCGNVPQALIRKLETSMEMWEALHAYYEGSGMIQDYNAIISFHNLRYEDFQSLEHYIVAFKMAVDRFEELELSLPERYLKVIFITAMAKPFPQWSERQRSLSRKREEGLSLEDLYTDVMKRGQKPSGRGLGKGFTSP